MRRHGHHFRRWALVAAAALVAPAAWIAGPAPAAAGVCPSPPTTLTELVGITADRLVACFGGRTLAIHAYVVRTTDLGGTNNYAIAPAWFDGWNFVELALQPTAAHATNARYGAGPYFFVASSAGWNPHPLARYVDSWVIVRGHVDDPAARTCHVTKVYTGTAPSRATIIRDCRRVFVLTGVTRSTESPATDTLSVTDGHAPGTPSMPAALVMMAGAGIGLALGGRLVTRRERRRA